MVRSSVIGRVFTAFLAIVVLSLGTGAMAADNNNPRVRLTTSHGAVVVELYPDKAPATVANFLKYVAAGQYNGTVFHRVIPGFMIQGGGFLPGMSQKPTGDPVKNEADNGLKNLTGTIAMARTGEPHSATAQFFINTMDNDFLNHRDTSQRGWGYAVFGKVVEGMDVVKRIEAVRTRTVGSFGDVPVNDVIIEKAEALAQ